MDTENTSEEEVKPPLSERDLDNLQWAKEFMNKYEIRKRINTKHKDCPEVFKEI